MVPSGLSEPRVADELITRWLKEALAHRRCAAGGAQSRVPPLRYFEAKNRSRTTEYQCPAMRSALPAIENVISSIVSVLPCFGSRMTARYVGSSGLNFKERVTPR